MTRNENYDNISINESIIDAEGNAVRSLNPRALDIVASGTAQLSNGNIIIPTGVTDTGATVSVALASPDGAQLTHNTAFRDGELDVDIYENGTSIGNPRVAYDIIHWRTHSFGDGGGGGGTGEALIDEDFEGEDYDQWWTETYELGVHDSLSTEYVHEGSRSLEALINEGFHGSVDANYDPYVAGDIPSNHDELFTEYWIYFEGPFDFNGTSCKIPGIHNDENNKPAGEPADGTNGWSVTGDSWDGGDGDPDTVGLEYYVYHMDMGGDWGEFYTGTTILEDSWHKVNQHVKLNTVDGSGNANYDGVMQLWVDDVLEIDEQSMRFVTDRSLSPNFNLLVYFGGAETSPYDQYIYFDNLRVGTTDFAGVLN